MHPDIGNRLINHVRVLIAVLVIVGLGGWYYACSALVTIEKVRVTTEYTSAAVLVTSETVEKSHEQIQKVVAEDGPVVQAGTNSALLVKDSREFLERIRALETRLDEKEREANTLAAIAVYYARRAGRQALARVDRFDARFAQSQEEMEQMRIMVAAVHETVTNPFGGILDRFGGKDEE